MKGALFLLERAAGRFTRPHRHLLYARTPVSLAARFATFESLSSEEDKLNQLLNKADIIVGGGSSNSSSSSSDPKQVLQPFSRTQIPIYNISLDMQISSLLAQELIIVPFIYSSKIKMGESLLDSMIPKCLNKTNQRRNSLRQFILNSIRNGSFDGAHKSKKILNMWSPKMVQGPHQNIALIGIQEDGDLSQAHYLLGKTAAEIIKELKPKSTCVIGSASKHPASRLKYLKNFTLGLDDSLYKDCRFKIKKDDTVNTSFEINLFFDKLQKGFVLAHPKTAKLVDDQLMQSSAISSGVVLAKDLVNAPPNCKTPLAIAGLVRDLFATDDNMELKILGYDECKKLGMEGYLAVQQGSKFDPQFIHLKYRPPTQNASTTKRNQRIVLIGKGLTFDSGGYNLKTGPSSMIELMKFDMGGCAAVFGCALAISKLQPLNIEVDFISAVCENMVSSNAMRPGDIVKFRNGKTAEIMNTDAEGRLTLADALLYAQNNISYNARKEGDGEEKIDAVAALDNKPDIIIDLATLTGACVVALGDKIAGCYSNNEQLSGDIKMASKSSFDKIWEMPLVPEYKDYIKGSSADIKNIGNSFGGSITASLFLQEFVESSIKWSHIDMAGPVWDSKLSSATGFGVKLLVDFLLNKSLEGLEVDALEQRYDALTGADSRVKKATKYTKEDLLALIRKLN